MPSTVLPLALSALCLFGGCAFDETGIDGEPRPPADPDLPDVPSEPQSPAGSDPAVDQPPVAYRLNAFALRDPHMFGQTQLGCSDITDGGTSSVNARTADSLASDRNDDGIRDLSLVVLVSDNGLIELAHADCTVDEPVTCTMAANRGVSTAATVAQGVCDLPAAGVLSGYDPPLLNTAAPCLETEPFDFVLDLTDPLPHTDVVLSLGFADDGQTLSGTFRGFLPEVEADALRIAIGFSTVPFSRFLPGGDGSCADHDARDSGPGGASGWYSYFNFIGEVVTLAP